MSRPKLVVSCKRATLPSFLPMQDDNEDKNNEDNENNDNEDNDNEDNDNE